jgi:peptidoglycan hydrolase CwlO-like protein
MSRDSKALTIFLVALLGAWGCAQSPSANATAQAERIRALEAKSVKLEDDYRAVVAARDQLRKNLASLESDNVRLETARLQLVKELEQKKVIVLERDALEVRCNRLKTKIQSILSEDEAATPTATPAPVSAAPANPVGG